MESGDTANAGGAESSSEKAASDGCIVERRGQAGEENAVKSSRGYRQGATRGYFAQQAGKPQETSQSFGEIATAAQKEVSQLHCESLASQRTGHA